MELDPELLRELHRIHRQRTDLMERIERGPRQLTLSQTRLEAAQAKLEQAKTKQTSTRMLADEKQLLMKERENRISSLQSKLNACETNKEFQTLKHQIAAEEQANEVLADEILELLERIDTQSEEISKLTQIVENAQKEHDGMSEAVAQEKKTLESELSRVQKMLEDAEVHLPAAFRVDYFRLTKSLGEDALARVEDECCGHCFQTLSAQTFNQLHMGKPVFCGSCGSVLYLPENYQVR